MAASPRSVGFLLAALVAAGLRAADPSPPAKSSDESIATAKRDFDALKSSRTPGDQPRAGGLALNLPTLQVADEDMESFLQREEAQKKKDKLGKPGKQKNWLVDAMMDKKPGEGDEAKTIVSGAPPNGSLNLVKDLGDLPKSDAKSSTSVRPSTTSLDNPLNNYMAGWMTSKDYELLKVKAEETNPGFAAGSGLEPLASPGRSTDAGRSDGLAGVGQSANSLSGEPRPNPYLADFGPSPGAGSVKESLSLPAPSAPSFTPAPPILPTPKTESPPEHNSPPPNEALKPSNDAKYFRQLKRF